MNGELVRSALRAGKNLPSSLERTLTALAAVAEENGRSWATADEVADMRDVAPETARRQLHLLLRRNLVVASASFDARGKRSANRYGLAPEGTVSGCSLVGSNSLTDRRIWLPRSKYWLVAYATNPDGTERRFFVAGQVARTLKALIAAGPKGVTSLDVAATWALRMSHYISILRHVHELNIEMVREDHVGPSGAAWHGRYHLITPVRLASK